MEIKDTSSQGSSNAVLNNQLNSSFNDSHKASPGNTRTFKDLRNQRKMMRHDQKSRERSLVKIDP
jgi:hypothetical protein